jgi:hypothetical protein
VSDRLIDGAAYYVVPRIPRWVVLLLVCVVGWYGGCVRLAPVLLREWGALLWYKRVLDGYKRSPRLLIYSFFRPSTRRIVAVAPPNSVPRLSSSLAVRFPSRSRRGTVSVNEKRLTSRVGRVLDDGLVSSHRPSGLHGHRRVAGKTGSL